VRCKYLNFESTAAKDVHVLGDSIPIAPGLPKSGHMANSHGKVAAAAIVAQLSGWDINPAPMLTNTCYSFVDNKNVVHVASVHEYVSAEKTFKTVAGSGGLSAAPSELEGVYALNWASNIWADTLLRSQGLRPHFSLFNSMAAGGICQRSRQRVGPVATGPQP
jgi:sulfide dehydrogenase [flavocytochrome c] flavoprotein subunit